MKIGAFAVTDNQEIQKFIIGKIRELINYKNLEPGDKLPSERKLSEKFEVSRSNIRVAIQTLESYGLLKSIPQSGTFVANIGVIAMNGIIEDILSIKTPDFKALVETRILLELKSVKCAALRHSIHNLKRIKEALNAYEEKVLSGKDAVQEDLLFHLAIARASGNSKIEDFMLTMTPQIITDFEKYHVCDEQTAIRGIKEHTEIFEAIKLKNTVLAKQKMKDHLNPLYEYCYNV